MECEPLKFPEVFYEAPLYKHYSIEDQQNFEKFLNFGNNFDGYCPQCKETSTFKHVGGIIASSSALIDPFFTFQFICKRNEIHRMIFVFKVFDRKYMVKIGQYPSMADIASEGIQKYKKELKNGSFSDLGRAVGLASHGVGIGSFVYLRRVFERLIEDVHNDVKKSPSWDENAYKKASPMDKRIELLRLHLPEFLVENRAIYGILSKGIHELGENECRDIFPVVRSGIELILDERIAERKRKKHQETITKGIQNISQNLKKKPGDTDQKV